MHPFPCLINFHSLPPSALSAGSDMDSLLSSTKTRNLFLDDLMELKEFLSQRIRELSTETSGVLMGQVRLGTQAEKWS